MCLSWSEVAGLQMSWCMSMFAQVHALGEGLIRQYSTSQQGWTAQRSCARVICQALLCRP